MTISLGESLTGDTPRKRYTSTSKKRRGLLERSYRRITPDPIEKVLSESSKTAGNLLNDVEDVGAGLFPGLEMLGKAIGHDAKRAVTGRGTFTLDDIGAAIAKDYQHTYGPLASGDFKEFARRVQAHPLGPVLDVMTIFSGGAAAAAKIGAKAAAGSGSLAGIGARAAGVTRSVDDAGKITLTPKSVKLRAKGVETDVPYAPSFRPVTSYTTRLRKQASAGISNIMPDAPVFGAAQRIGRKQTKDIERRALTETSRTMRETKVIGGARYSKPAQAARAIHLAAPDNPKHRLDTQIAFLNQNLVRVTKARDIDEDSLKELSEYVSKKQPEMEVLVARKDAKGEEAPQFSRYEQVVLDRYNAAKEMLWENKEANRLIPVLSGRIKVLSHPRTAELVANPDAKLQKLLEADRVMASKTAEVLGEAAGLAGRKGSAGDRAQLETQILRDAGFDVPDEPRAVVRTHQSITDKKIKKSMSTRPPGVARENRGINFKYGADAFDPRRTIQSYIEAHQWLVNLRKTQRMLQLAVHKSDLDGDTAGMVNLTHTKMGRYADEINKFMDEMSDFFGDDSPQLAEFKVSLDEYFAKAGRGDLFINERIYKALAPELKNADEFVKRYYDKPTAVWKAIVLGLRPAFIVSNVVGQLMLLLATQGVYKSLRGLLATMPGTEARRALSSPTAILGEAGWGRTERAVMFGMSNSISSKTLRMLAKPSDLVFKLTSILSDDLPRKGLFYELLRPSVTKLRRSDSSLSYTDAANIVMKDPKVFDEMIEQVLSDLVDFRSLTSQEKRVMRRIVPFWTWLKGSTTRTARLAGDEPWKVLEGATLGELGVEYNEDRFGELPSFLKGALDAPAFLAKMVGGDDEEGRAILTTAALNPFQTPVDVTKMVPGLFSPKAVGGANPLAQINPFAKSAMEALSNRDYFSGYPIDPYGDLERSVFDRFVERVALSTPQTQQLKKLAGKGQEGYKPLYEVSPQSELLKWAGVPVRRVSLSEARRRAKQQRENKLATLT